MTLLLTKFPTGIAHLTTGLADMDRHDFSHFSGHLKLNVKTGLTSLKMLNDKTYQRA